MRRSSMAAVVLLLPFLATAGCGGEPPETLGEFGLDLSQREVMEAARLRGGFSCRLRATHPPEATCAGPVEEGDLTAFVRDDSVIRLTLRLTSDGEEPGRRVRQFVRPFGSPAWRDRPQPPRSPRTESYHTLWLDDDSTRALGLSCQGPALEPPCTAELYETSPAGVQARLDTLLGLRR